MSCSFVDGGYSVRDRISNLRISDYSIQIMVEIGIVEIIGMGGALGIIGTMLIVMYFSRKQAQGFNLDIETHVLNDLDEKVRTTCS